MSGLGARNLYLDCDLGQVHVRRWGDAAAPVVALLHWTPGSGAQFDSVGPALARRGRQAWALDMLGFGRSARPPLDWTQAAHAVQLWKALDSAGVDRVALLGGHMGGEVALEMARQQPARTEALVLDGVGVHWDRAKRTAMIEAIDYTAPPPDADGAQMRWAWSKVAFLWNAWAPGHDVAHYAPLLHQGMIDVLEPRFDIRPMAAAFSAYDPNQTLPTLTVPTLILTADSDTLRDGFEAALAATPGGLGYVFPGVHPVHSPDGGEDYAAVVDAFLGGRPDGRFLRAGNAAPRRASAGGYERAAL